MAAMDPETRAELITLRAFCLLTLGQLAALRPDTDEFLSEARRELIRALSSIRIEPESEQEAVRAHAVAFTRDWFTHIHLKDDDSPAPY